MTVNKLYKLLGKMVADGQGRLEVCINKDTFTHPLEGDGCVIQSVMGAEIEAVVQMDGDGWTKVTKRGQECYRRTAVLYGCNK